MLKKQKTRKVAPSPPLPLGHFSLGLLSLLGRGGKGEGALLHPVGLATAVAAFLGRLLDLPRAMDLVLPRLAPAAPLLLGLEIGLPVLVLQEILTPDCG